jgi:hypothetical protein
MSSKEVMSLLKRNEIVVSASKAKLILEKMGAMHSTYKDDGKAVKGYRRLKLL